MICSSAPRHDIPIPVSRLQQSDVDFNMDASVSSKTFIAENEVQSLSVRIQEVTSHGVAGLADQLTNLAGYLNEAVAARLSIPITTYFDRRDDHLILWETWHLQVSRNCRLVTISMLGLEPSESSMAYSSDRTFMLVAENLKIREVYTSWLRGKLREWCEGSPVEHRVSATLLLMDDEVHRMADRLESLFTHSLATMAIYGWLAQNEYAGRLSEWLGSEFIKELPDPLMRAICRHAQWLCRLDGDRNLVPLLARLCEIKATTRPDRDFLRSMGVSNKMLTRFRKVPVNAVKSVVSHLPDAPDGAKRYLRQWAEVLKLADLSKPDASLDSWKPHPLLPSLCQLLAHLERHREIGVRHVPHDEARQLLAFGVEDEQELLIQEVEEEDEQELLIQDIEEDLEEQFARLMMTLLPKKDRYSLDAIQKMAFLYRDHLVSYGWEAGGTSHHDDGGRREVFDWFLATRPTIDKNRRKLGWHHLTKLSSEWHHALAHEFEAMLIEEQLGHYGNQPWECKLDKCGHDWAVEIIPEDSSYGLRPLTSPQALMEESRAMAHCVYSYGSACLSGYTRIFSIYEKCSGSCHATVELVCRNGSWSVNQLKGKYNLELMGRFYNHSDPLREMLDRLVAWYNSH